MGTHDLEADLREASAAQHGLIAGAGSTGAEAVETQLRALTHAVGADVDAALARYLAEPARARVVGAHDDETVLLDRPHEVLESTLDRCGVAVVVEVVGLDVGHDGRERMVGEEGAVALVRLDDEQLTSAVVGVAGCLVEVAADGE